tara:strand:- start:668 stop:1099 length:432 start_codon:yes stop_codon:yes gene_type:complete
VFKLGREKGLEATNGEIKTKLRFGRQPNGIESIPGTPIIPMPLADGIMGEANMDGSIFVNELLDPNSEQYRKVINHEMRHATDMRIGKLAYADDHIMYNGERFERTSINGVDAIKVDGEWKEAGSHGFPWEMDANNGNENGEG